MAAPGLDDIKQLAAPPCVDDRAVAVPHCQTGKPFGTTRVFMETGDQVCKIGKHGLDSRNLIGGLWGVGPVCGI